MEALLVIWFVALLAMACGWLLLIGLLLRRKLQGVESDPIWRALAASDGPSDREPHRGN